MYLSRDAIKQSWDDQKAMKCKKLEESIAKSKKENILVSFFEYWYLIVQINIWARRRFNLVKIRTKYYVFKEKTLKKLEDNGFEITRDYYPSSNELKINWL